MVIIPNVVKFFRVIADVIVEARQARLAMMKRYPGLLAE